MLLALLLLATASDAITLAPAPGAPPSASITLSGKSVPLGPDGRALIHASGELSAPGFRFYRIGDRAFYYPSDDTLVTWPLPGLDRVDGTRTGAGVEAEVVTKEHDSDS